MKKLSLGFALALVLGALQARAGPTVADLAEAGAPDSVLNKDAPLALPVEASAYEAQLREAERGSPDSVDARRAPKPAPIDARMMADEVEAAEAGNPHSTISGR